MSHRHFTCVRCHRTFIRNPNVDPMAEARRRFGDAVDHLEVVSVCDSCGQAFQAWLQTPLGQQALAEWKAEQQ